MSAAKLRVGIMTVSDRAYNGVYEDKSGPAIKEWLTKALTMHWEAVNVLVPDEQKDISQQLVNLSDNEKCHIIFTTGGTGPAKRDVTPEATLAIATKVLDGIGERMRSISLKYTPSAILSRQVGVIRNETLIINLPGKPKAINEILVEIFPAIPDCVYLLEGPEIQTNEEIVKGHNAHKH